MLAAVQPTLPPVTGQANCQAAQARACALNIRRNATILPAHEYRAFFLQLPLYHSTPQGGLKAYAHLQNPPLRRVLRLMGWHFRHVLRVEQSSSQ